MLTISSLLILFALFHINLSLSIVQYSKKSNLSILVSQCISCISGPKLDAVCWTGSNKLQGVLPFQEQPPCFSWGSCLPVHSAQPGPCGQKPCPWADQLTPLWTKPLLLSRSTHPQHINTPTWCHPKQDQRKVHCVLQSTLNWLYLWAGCFELLGFGKIGLVWVFFLDFWLVLLGFGFWGFYWGKWNLFCVCFLKAFCNIFISRILSLEAIMHNFNGFHLLLQELWISIY